MAASHTSIVSIPTGQAGHWHTLLRARAIESQCYVIAAAQAGRHNEKRASYGHGLIVGPWGDIKAEIGPTDDDGSVGETDATIATAEIELDEVEWVRTGMPLRRRTWVDFPYMPHDCSFLLKSPYGVEHSICYTTKNWYPLQIVR